MGMLDNIRNRMAEARAAQTAAAAPPQTSMGSQFDPALMAQQMQSMLAAQQMQGQQYSNALQAQRTQTANQPTLGSFREGPAPMAAFTEQFTAPTLAELQATPGYGTRLKAGQDALERSASARGTLLTGGTLKGLEKYAQDYAANEYASEFDRQMRDFTNRANIHYQNEGNRFNSDRSNRMDDWNIYGDTWNMGRTERLDDFNIWNTMDSNYWNRLMGLGSLGATAASGMANNGANLITGMGNAGAAGTVASGNAWGNAVGNIGSQAADALTLSAMLRQQPRAQPQIPQNTGYTGVGMPGPIQDFDYNNPETLPWYGENMSYAY